MISKKLFPIIILIYFFQYVSERNLNYFNFQKVSKKNVPMHHPSIKKSLTYLTRKTYGQHWFTSLTPYLTASLNLLFYRLPTYLFSIFSQNCASYSRVTGVIFMSKLKEFGSKASLCHMSLIAYQENSESTHWLLNHDLPC